METNFTEQQSLTLINEMIDRARNNVQKGSADHMIFWGFAIALIAILNFVLLQVLDKPYLSFWVWTLAIPCWFIDFLLSRKIDRSALMKTQIDTIISTTWRAFGISCAIFIGLIFWLAYGMHHNILFLTINPVIMLMVGICQYVTGQACRFKPFTYGAFVMWIAAICSVAVLFIFKRMDIQFLFLAGSMLLSFVVTGYQLNKKAN